MTDRNRQNQQDRRPQSSSPGNAREDEQQMMEGTDPATRQRSTHEPSEEAHDRGMPRERDRGDVSSLREDANRQHDSDIADTGLEEDGTDREGRSNR